MKPTKIHDAASEIDWGKPMWVINGVILVRTNGNHQGMFFEGLAFPYKGSYTDLFSNNWRKDAFKPLTSPLTITIEN